jgi:hypothetical protein
MENRCYCGVNNQRWHTHCWYCGRLLPKPKQSALAPVESQSHGCVHSIIEHAAKRDAETL